MTKQYTQRDEEFKKMIVNLCETSSDKTMSDIAREYGVSRTNITNWRKKYGTITTSTGITTSKITKKESWIRNRKWNIKKSSGHILKKIEDKIKFIDDYKYLYDVRTLCNCLGIHHSVYYYHCNHLTNSYIESNQKLDIEIRKIYDESKGRYGSPKITKVLNSNGINVSQKWDF